MKVNEEKVLTVEEFYELAKNGGKYEIETPQGWVEIDHAVINLDKECYLLRTELGKKLGGSIEHPVKTINGFKTLEEVDVEKDSVITIDGEEEIVAKEYIGIKNTYDFHLLSDEHEYYSNGIVSHNCGKTTLARIMAMGLNCEKGDTGEPCLECDSCKDIMANKAMHVTELNLARLNKKEDAEEIVNNMSLTTLTGRNKIYIFDEAQMLTNAAQNLLLKNLEEPPPNTYIFLCTTHPQKIIPAVRNRCEQYEFKLPNENEVKSILRDVFEQEPDWELSVDDKVKFLDKIMGSSIRGILKSIDKVVRGGIDSLTNISDDEAEHITICRAIVNGDWKAIVSELNKYKKDNPLDAEGLRRCILGYFRAIILKSNIDERGAAMVEAMRVFKEPYFDASSAKQLIVADLYEATVIMLSNK